MTLPGFIQALLILIFGVGSFIYYFRSPPRSLFFLLVAGCAAILVGLLLISLNWFAPPTLSDVWNFRAPDFYQGTVLFSLGVGIILGNTSAWLVSCVRRLR
jgi:hypothetical protein